MTQRGKTLVSGHTLLFEGSALGHDSSGCGAGVGGCSCGERSPELPNRAARKRWHKEHKAAIVADRKEKESNG